ncbi:MAG: hypothetical protein Fues2KO_07650 [Fuerstiella sp.]
MTYWIAAITLLLLNTVFVLLNFLMLPGNWLMVGSLCVFMLVVGPTAGPSLTTLIVVVVLAIVGELVELLTGSAAAKKMGASRRAMMLSLIVSVTGAIVGTFVVPIPVVGSAIGAVGGAALGAFVGAWVGEAWKGTQVAQRGLISHAAMKGRLLGMLGKLAIGGGIFVLQMVSLF